MDDQPLVTVHRVRLAHTEMQRIHVADVASAQLDEKSDAVDKQDSSDGKESCHVPVCS